MIEISRFLVKSASHPRRALSTAPIVSPNHMIFIFTAHTHPTSLNVNLNFGIQVTPGSMDVHGCAYREHPSLSTHPPHALPTPSSISYNRAASIFTAHTLPTSLKVNPTFEVKAMEQTTTFSPSRS